MERDSEALSRNDSPTVSGMNPRTRYWEREHSRRRSSQEDPSQDQKARLSRLT